MNGSVFFKRFVGLLIVTPLVAGGALLCWLLWVSRGAPPVSGQVPCPLHVVRVGRFDVRPRVVAYGTAQPDQTWRAVARIDGLIAHINSAVRPGAVIDKGTALMLIDPASCQVNVDKAEADIRRLEAQLDQIDRQAVNDLLSLEIEKSSLEVAERQLARARTLLERDATSQAAVDEDERSELLQRRIVQSLENKLNLVPPNRQAKEAELASGRAALAKVQQDMSCALVMSPCRFVVWDVLVGEGQFVAANDPLLEAYRCEGMRVKVQVDYDLITPLLTAEVLQRLKDASVSKEPHNALEGLFDIVIGFHSGFNIFERPGCLTEVRHVGEMPGRTLALTVVAANPKDKAASKGAPLLLKDSRCEVEFRGGTLAGQLVIPRQAVHDGGVFVLDERSRLRRRPVKVLFEQADFVVVSQGLAAGESVVSRYPGFAKEGLLVKAVEDKKMLNRLRRQVVLPRVDAAVKSPVSRQPSRSRPTPRNAG